MNRVSNYPMELQTSTCIKRIQQGLYTLLLNSILKNVSPKKKIFDWFKGLLRFRSDVSKPFAKEL